MCFKKPETPKVYVDKALVQQQQDARAAAAAQRASDKDARTEARLAALSGRMGRGAILTGGKGGMGYATPQARSLFEVMA